MKTAIRFIQVAWSVAIVATCALFLFSASGGELPTLAEAYLTSFISLLDSLSYSHWSFIVFVIAWFGLSYSFGKQSGWQALAEKYKANEVKGSDIYFRICSGYIGNSRYNGILKVAANSNGVYLKVISVFRFGHKSLLIPWEEVSAITSEHGLFSEKTPSFIKRLLRLFPNSEYMNIGLRQFPKQRITIKTFAEIIDQIPRSLKS